MSSIVAIHNTDTLMMDIAEMFMIVMTATMIGCREEIGGV